MTRRSQIPIRRLAGAKQASQTTSGLTKLLQDALVLHRQGKLHDAKILYERILKKQSNHFDAIQLLASLCTQLKQPELALIYFDQALEINNQNAAVLNNRGIALKELKRFDDALLSYEAALRINPDYADAHFNRGNVLQELKRLHDALKSYDAALHIKPDFADAFKNRGVVLKELKRHDDALISYEAALRIKPNDADALYNQGNALKELRRYHDAIRSYETALRIKPDYANAFYNRGNALKELKRLHDAVMSYEAALRIKPDLAEAFYNRGIVLQELNRLDDALISNIAALRIKPESNKFYAHLFMLRQQMADWSGWHADINSIKNNSHSNFLDALGLFRLQSIPGLSSAEILNNTSAVIKKKIEAISPLRQTLGFPPSPILKDKINLGFLSMDFRNHVVMRLLSEFFERINREKFRLFAYSYGVDDKSELRKQAENSFDVFRDVRLVSDEQVAKQIAEDEVHILIDLAGHTEGSRLEITLLKPAPITVHMASDVGTLGKGAVDYKTANNDVAMKNIYQEQYAESLILVPPSIAFDTRIVPPAPDTRQAHGLPKEGFVFCSFNQIYKINPPLFDCWMQILREVPDSVMWLWADDLGVQSRLKAEAVSRGVDESRLVFAKKVPLSSHYARMQLADLALDTFPYGSHSTGRHALWCGVPLLGFTGDTPASRVSAALLTLCGLPELSVEGGYEAYAHAAIDLAKDRQRLASIRQKLINTVRQEGEENPFCINHKIKIFEAAMEQIWRRHEQGLPVETFEVQL